MSDLDDIHITRAALTGIQCTLADLQLVQNVLIDVTVTVSRDYGILSTGVCNDISLDAAEQFGYTVQELKNIAMQLKQNTGWVPMRERWSSRKRRKQQRAEERRRAKESKMSDLTGDDEQDGQISENDYEDFTADLHGETSNASETTEPTINKDPSPESEPTMDTSSVDNDTTVDLVKEEGPDEYNDEQSYGKKEKQSHWSNSAEAQPWTQLIPQPQDNENAPSVTQNNVVALPSSSGSTHTATLSSLVQHLERDSGVLESSLAQLQSEIGRQQQQQDGSAISQLFFTVKKEPEENLPHDEQASCHVSHETNPPGGSQTRSSVNKSAVPTLESLLRCDIRDIRRQATVYTQSSTKTSGSKPISALENLLKRSFEAGRGAAKKETISPNQSNYYASLMTCEICQESCSHYDMDKHMEAHHVKAVASGTREFTCESCGRRFPTVAHTVSHLRVHVSVLDGPMGLLPYHSLKYK